ncbi:hypothetical protein MLD38_009054 [Melastoma candidum]|uniref:Uncharacterized protein n=1 Tax=Melastoma candidum TaxID=119954 RepID=A0ACB9RW08_9MYRT|nr:hypothetical protein MLD38_009054 [Melastoma candidum]
MGNSTSRVVGCFVPNGRDGGDVEFADPLDEGLGHSFCYVRPTAFESPAITPSNSERFTVDSSTLDSEALSGSFRHDNVEDASSLNRSNKNVAETTFKTISGASVSANVSTARTGYQGALFNNDAQEPAASFESTASFAAIPLQPLPRGSGPLNGFMSGPLERGFASGPLDGGAGFMSGPMERGVMSGPLDAADKSNFSAPLARGRRRKGFQSLMRSVSGPMRNTITRTFSRHSIHSHWMQRFFLYPVSQLAWNMKEPKYRIDESREGGCSEGGHGDLNNLQWAQGKAGEDRVHVVLSEQQGWLYIGIYDGFSGPDAPDFLMSHLYRAIDKELEGVLWSYEVIPSNEQKNSEPPKSKIGVGISGHGSVDQPLPKPDKLISCSSGVCARVRSSHCENCEKDRQNKETAAQVLFHPDKQVITETSTGPCKKSMRLYELLQIELWDARKHVSPLDGARRRGSWDSQEMSNGITKADLQKEHLRSHSLNSKSNLANHVGGPSTSGADGGIGTGINKNNDTVLHAVPVQRQSSKKSLISSKIKNMYRKQKSLRKKLFPWSYDWYREQNIVDEGNIEPSGPIRRFVSGTVSHDAILGAMSRALQKTEEAYTEMVEKALDKNAELALMGSCVLVMLMKDQDVYVMNLGDSRVILAQERHPDRLPNPNMLKDDLQHRNKSRELLVRMELDRISEESPVHVQANQVNAINKNREISICRLRMRALQLSTDHSTSVDEEVQRVRSEHPDDNQAIMNDRVKGQLKVTRAFGAGFLKKPTLNEALLGMFRVDYVGSSPYVSCTPSLAHHRLSSSDRFLVLSSDGLYQYFSNEEVVGHVTWFVENVPEGDPAQYLIAELLFRAAKNNGMDFHELLDIPQGDRRKYHDDVSVMVVSLEGRIWRSSG